MVGLICGKNDSFAVPDPLQLTQEHGPWVLALDMTGYPMPFQWKQHQELLQTCLWDAYQTFGFHVWLEVHQGCFTLGADRTFNIFVTQSFTSRMPGQTISFEIAARSIFLTASSKYLETLFVCPRNGCQETC